MQKQITRLPPYIRPPNLIRRILVSWLLAVTIEYLLLPAELRDLSGLQGLRQMSLLRVLSVTGLGTVLLSGISRFCRSGKAERWGITALFAVLAAAALTASYSPAFLGACLIVLGILILYALAGRNKHPEPLGRPQPAPQVYIWITAALALGLFVIVSGWTVGRVAILGTSTYDFGIFAQMFHSMKETGLPLTTLERDGLLSHFDVHVSPIYYLMLPFYCLAPYPATLQVLQAAVMASAVIPLWKIGKAYGLSGPHRTLLCAVLLFYPAFACGASYDLHENCFLMPLLLWLLYGIVKKNTVITALAAVLTLMVKEDAAVYVAVVALWLLVKTLLSYRKLDRKDLLTALLLFLVSLGWFFLATGHLAKNGDGVMTYRYNNFMFDRSGSLITVIQAVLLNPMKAISECVDPEKLEYIAITMLPLLGLPLLTRRYERYILLIPYLLINLMSDYPYQHNIHFQYSFGSTALLLYLTAANLADLKQEKLRGIPLILSVVICLVCFQDAVYVKAVYYPNQAALKYDYYQEIRDALDLIPENASVTSTGYYTTYLSNRETLYDVRYTSRTHLLESEYIVLNIKDADSFKKYATDGKDNGLENFLLILEENGYELFAEVEGTLVIYRQAGTGD